MNKVIQHFAAIILEKFPVTTVKLRYFLRFGRLPNFKHPKDLNEKILYLKLFTDTSKWTELADKYRVHEYVKACGLESILIPLYGAWEKVDDIPFDELPQQFILKANNGDGKGTNVKIDKEKMSDEDWKELRVRLQSWLDTKHIGALSGEPQYRDIKPMILAEELLPCGDGETSLVDYKLWCFHGEPYSFLTCSERQADGYHTSVDCYDLRWNRHSENMKASSHVTIPSKALPRPQCLAEMISIAATLSKPFPQVRVDLYEVNGKAYFGELTFTSLGGMMDYYKPEYLLEMGKRVTIPSIES
ncbi:MAG: hypothetical protein J5661_02800 [Bacteroidaceae bacterium]|nr:hypothetical protein [Bacteroidaceae bacterium]